MKTGIICALPEEAVGFGLKSPHAGAVYALSEHLALCVSGMGAQRAKEAAHALISSGAKRLISWGTCAALQPQWYSGQLLLGNDVDEYPCHEALVAELENTLRSIPFERTSFTQAAQLLHTNEHKQELFQETQAGAADMESYAIAKLAAERDIPFAIVRAVADTATMPLPSYLHKTQNADGFISIPQLFFQTIIRPCQWMPCVNLLCSGMQAQTALRRAAKLF